MFRNIIIILTIAAATIPATAAIIYDNGSPPNETSGAFSGSWNTLQFMTFSLEPGANVITGVTWYGAYRWFNPYEDIGSGPWAYDAFDVIIWEYYDHQYFGDLVAEIGGPITRTPTGTFLTLYGSGQVEIFQYTMPIAPLELEPNHLYDLMIANFGSPSEDSQWIWASSGLGEGHSFTYFQGQPQLGGGGGLAFYLTGPDPISPVVPEPASLSLLGLGILGLLIRLRANVCS